jgi:hypothetical protein
MKAMVRRELGGPIDSVLPIERLADAQRKLDARGTRGKIVITIG